MKNEIREILGFNVPIVGIVETLDEAIGKAGSKEAVLKDYVSNVLAHSHYSVARRIIVETLEKVSGIPRNKDKEGKVIEKDAEYIARLEDQLGEAGLAGFTKAIADEVEKVPVDYTPGTRGSGSTSPAKKWLAMFDGLVAEDKLASFSTKYGVDVTTGTDEEIKTRVALALKEIVTAKEQAAAKEALNV